MYSCVAVLLLVAVRDCKLSPSYNFTCGTLAFMGVVVRLGCTCWRRSSPWSSARRLGSASCGFATRWQANLPRFAVGFEIRHGLPFRVGYRLHYNICLSVEHYINQICHQTPLPVALSEAIIFHFTYYHLANSLRIAHRE